ncbi:MAG: LacI family DNA-binding transcriptional regulator [Alphaproteobacteria bacterium]
MAGTKRPRRPRGSTAGVTLADVAALAGVSEVTVSRLLRNKPYISPETKERVLAAIREVGYLPNRIAGTLASAEASNLVGVIIPSLTNIVYPEVLQGIHVACGTAGLQPVVGVTNYDTAIEERLVGSLLSWRPTALLVAGFEHTEETRHQLQHSRVRVAELMDIDSEPIDIAIGMSHRRAGHATASHLVQRGYRRFGYVGHDWQADRRARIRYEGLCEGLAEAGLSVGDRAIFAGPSSVAAGKSMLAELLDRAPDLDAVVFSNDDMAVGGVFHSLACGIALKERLAIFGFNGIEIGQSLPIPLSTVRSNRFRIGKVAIETVLAGAERPHAPVVVDTGYEIVEGGTA